MSPFLDGRKSGNGHLLLGFVQVGRRGILRDVREIEEPEQGNGKRDDPV